MLPRGAVALTLVIVGSWACGDAGGGSDDTDGGSSASGVPEGPPEAPTLDTVAAMHGALHVFWTNETTNCDAIEGERSIDDAPFEPIFSVDGDVEDIADDDATDPTLVYSYRLRCRRGDEVSPYSNVDARSPKGER
jgi:hypothetical protein